VRIKSPFSFACVWSGGIDLGPGTWDLGRSVFLLLKVSSSILSGANLAGLI
jgi:hypothetical protein